MTRVTTATATSGAGTAAVRRGSSTTISTVAAASGYTAHGTPIRCCSWAVKISTPSALTKPIITERGMYRTSRASPAAPNAIWISPASTTVGSTYSTPCSFTIGPTTSATEPAAAVTMAGRPPRNDIDTASTTEAISATSGPTPEMMENEITSGISASVVTMPASTSVVMNDGCLSRARIGTWPRSSRSASSGEECSFGGIRQAYRRRGGRLQTGRGPCYRCRVWSGDSSQSSKVIVPRGASAVPRSTPERAARQ